MRMSLKFEKKFSLNSALACLAYILSVMKPKALLLKNYPQNRDKQTENLVDELLAKVLRWLRLSFVENFHKWNVLAYSSKWSFTKSQNPQSKCLEKLLCLAVCRMTRHWMKSKRLIGVKSVGTPRKKLVLLVLSGILCLSIFLNREHNWRFLCSFFDVSSASRKLRIKTKCEKSNVGKIQHFGTSDWSSFDADNTV